MPAFLGYVIGVAPQAAPAAQEVNAPEVDLVEEIIAKVGRALGAMHAGGTGAMHAGGTGAMHAGGARSHARWWHRSHARWWGQSMSKRGMLAGMHRSQGELGMVVWDMVVWGCVVLQQQQMVLCGDGGLCDAWGLVFCVPHAA